jgi:hypothetical protein
MWPREHGAYGQIAFPLVTSFLVAGITVPALLLALALIAGFLAHEPLLVLLGRRGARAKAMHGRRALMWFVLISSGGLVAAATAWWLSSADVRWSLVLPMLPAACVAGAVARHNEKSAVGELGVALTFSLAAVPVALAAGGALEVAISIAAVFALTFVPATLAVRALILDVRGGGNARAARVSRVAAIASATLGLTALGVAGAAGVLPPLAWLAAVPGAAAAVWIALRPPPPTRLRAVGWTLVTASTAAAVLLVAVLLA